MSDWAGRRRRRALITGVTGQDGAYLSELLLQKGYDVYGLTRSSEPGGVNLERLRYLGVDDKVLLTAGDMTNLTGLSRILTEVEPDEVYNLAAESFAPASWREPVQTAQITGMGALNVLEAVRLIRPNARLYQASSSEMFGRTRQPRQTETTPFQPRSPYGAAKLYAHWMTVNYREGFGLHASSGILFNHESPLRGRGFVTRKVTDGVARIKLGLETELPLGNIESLRDWGHARDFVRAMHSMLQQEEPDDYVIATGRAISVRQICEIAFAHVGLKADDHIVIRPDLFRATEADVLAGDASKARKVLGWSPEISVEAMIAEMVDADLLRLGRAALAAIG